MTEEKWFSLDIKEQLSNVHGEVERMIRSRNNYVIGKSKNDYSIAYMNKIHKLIALTCSDPKNVHRRAELIDEENEIQRWISGEVEDAYILRYWEQYTRAIS